MTAQDTTTKYAGYARGEVLVTPRWLEEHLLDPALRVVEVEVSPAAYDGGTSTAPCCGTSTAI